MPKEVRFSALVDYFKRIAVEHRQIQHDDTHNHFYRFEVDEVLSGIHSLRYPALILEGYRFSFGDQKADNPVKKRQGAFILLDHVTDPGDHDQVSTRYGITSKISGMISWHESGQTSGIPILLSGILTSRVWMASYWPRSSGTIMASVSPSPSIAASPWI